MRTMLYINASHRSKPERDKLSGLRRFVRERDWELMPIFRQYGRPDLKTLLREVAPAGVVVEASDGREDYPRRLFGGLPAVYLDGNPAAYGRRVHAVLHDTSRTIDLAIREFKVLELSSVAYAGTFDRTYWSEARRKCFEAAAEAAGLECRVFASDLGEERQGQYIHDLSAWLCSLPPQTGILAANDLTASLVVSCCGRLGISIPRELMLIGVDNDAAICMEAGITSIMIDFEKAGYLAGELLETLVDAAERPRRETVVFGPVGIFRRESTRAYFKMPPNIARAMSLIHERSCAGLSAAEVAKTLGGCRRGAEARFREATGKSILEAIQAERVERACSLLRNTEKPVWLVAQLCGYSSPAAMEKIFRRTTGATMLKWRRG